MPIPKTIHYCWFGGNPIPKQVQNYIETWRCNCPGYDFRCWTEDNYDVHKNEYVEEAYRARKWAFVSDFCRLDVLFHYGGVYLDTDIEMLKPITPFLKGEAFLGFETNDTLSTAVIGAERGHYLIEEMLDSYKDEHFIVNGVENCTPNVIRLTELCKSKGLMTNGKKQNLQGVEVYPQVVFSPNALCQVWGKSPAASVTVHHMDGSWRSRSRENSVFGRGRTWGVGVLRNILGTVTVSRLSHLLGGKK